MLLTYFNGRQVGGRWCEVQKFMDKKPDYLGRSGRWLIFAGLPMMLVAVLFVCFENNLERKVGTRAFPYFLYFTPLVILVAGQLVYEHLPKRLLIPLGVIGWIVTASVLCWFFWIGPGALKM
jgi:hypothetical protein